MVMTMAKKSAKTDGRQLRYEGFTPEELSELAKELQQTAGKLLAQAHTLNELGIDRLEFSKKVEITKARRTLQQFTAQIKGKITEAAEIRDLLGE